MQYGDYVKVTGRVKIEYMPIDVLKENPDNARQHGSEVEGLVNSVGDFGFADVIKVDKNMQIIAGHGRLIAAKRNGVKEVPVMVLPFDAEEAKAFALVDNKTHDNSTWDYEIYERQLKELKDLGWSMDNFGFELPSFDYGDEVPDIEIPDDPTPNPVAPARESFNVMAYCESEEDRDRVLAFLLKNNIPGQALGN